MRERERNCKCVRCVYLKREDNRAEKTYMLTDIIYESEKMAAAMMTSSSCNQFMWHSMIHDISWLRTTSWCSHMTMLKCGSWP